MTNRVVEVGDRKYRITIGYGAFQRLDALAVFVQAGTAVDVEETVDVQTDGDMKKATEVTTTALRSEELVTKDEAEEMKILGDLGGDVDLFDMINAEQKFREKVQEVKVRILTIAVRDEKNHFLNVDYIEYDLSPSDGEELFTLVMETFELIKSELADEDRKKKS